MVVAKPETLQIDALKAEEYNTTKTTPTPGHVPSLPEYLSAVQSKAVRLSGVVSAIAFLDNEGRCEEGRSALTYIAEELSRELSRALDIVNLPAGTLE